MIPSKSPDRLEYIVGRGMCNSRHRRVRERAWRSEEKPWCKKRWLVDEMGAASKPGKNQSKQASAAEVGNVLSLTFLRKTHLTPDATCLY